ncbi:MAG TPA: HAD hydrolase-like protein [Vicinamibacteria bacterium]|nr:HAD hydrolase-like protein [Vicinamibacteria bacterium]
MLFDIDGTLLSAGGVSSRALEDALQETFGAVGPVAGYDYSGKTDPQIVRELMRGAGFLDEEIVALRSTALERYRSRLLELLRPEDVVAKPGVGPLLEALAATRGVTLGLLTGNLEPCARAKLAPLRANRHFPFGAFGSDHEDRYRLPALAVARARDLTGLEFAGKRVVVVGDSIHDVLCGRGLGVRAVAVATGRTPQERLAAESPDALLDDFSQTEVALRAILGEPA